MQEKVSICCDYNIRTSQGSYRLYDAFFQLFFFYKDGFYESLIIFNNLITAYVPFLPLEKKHIRSCIIDYLIKKEQYNEREQIPEDIWDTFSRELLYYPEDEELFSVSGCRRVPDKTQYVMDDF